MGTATCLHGYQRLVLIGEKCRHTVALEFVPLNLACFDMDDVELKYVLGNIHSDDGLH